MKRIYFIFLICLCTFISCYSQSFEKIFATPNDDVPSYSVEDSDDAVSVQATKDGGCLITGTRYDNTNPFGQQKDIYIVKTDSTGLTGIGVEGNIQLYDFLLYPNPVSQKYFWIQSGTNIDIKSVQATDMLGKTSNLHFSKEDAKIKVSNTLLPGVYNITIITKDNKYESHRLLIQ